MEENILLKEEQNNFYNIKVYFTNHSLIKVVVMMNGMEASSGDKIHYVKFNDLFLIKIGTPFISKEEDINVIEFLMKD